MKRVYIVHENHPRLLIFFAGWGADETPFKDYRPANSDYMICYDYRDLSFDPQIFRNYKQLIIIGWSMGVWAASQVLGRIMASGSTLPIICGAVAINGTPFPIDEERGIPPTIYHGTLDGLTGASLHKFLRRMCANSTEFKKFLAVTPRRPLEELRDELAAIEATYTAQPAYAFEWGTAVVSTEDRIIPPDNQRRAWMHNHRLIEIETAHYDPELFEKYLEKEWIND